MVVEVIVVVWYTRPIILSLAYAYHTTARIRLAYDHSYTPIIPPLVYAYHTTYYYYYYYYYHPYTPTKLPLVYATMKGVPTRAENLDVK